MLAERKKLCNILSILPDFEKESVDMNNLLKEQIEKLNSKSGFVLGELGHPDCNDISLTKSCILFDKFELNDEYDIYSDVSYLKLDNGRGEDAKFLIESGIGKFAPRCLVLKHDDKTYGIKKIFTFDVILNDDVNQNCLHTRRLINSEYSKIKESKDSIKNIQEVCKHEKTHIVDYMYRPGAISKVNMCIYCDAILTNAEIEIMMQNAVVKSNEK